MKRTLTCLSLSLAISSGTIMPAFAGDLGPQPDYSTGISPYGVATPVPAPIPVPYEEPAWYFRADFAAGFGSQPSFATSGLPFGSGAAANTIGVNAGWASASYEPAFTGGVGVGYIWGPNIRTDLTVDMHSTMNANFNGTQTYTGGSVSIQDKTKLASTVLLMNGYYDFRTGTPFTPYIGGGLGFAVNQLTQEIAFTDTVNGAGSAASRSTQVQFAAAAMVGLTYDINSFIGLDVNYRFLYIGGTGVDTPLNSASSKIDVGSIDEHQIRAGLRFYIN